MNPVHLQAHRPLTLHTTVYEVLDYLAFDMSEEEILEDFPDLTKEDLKACTAFSTQTKVEHRRVDTAS